MKPLITTCVLTSLLASCDSTSPAITGGAVSFHYSGDAVGTHDFSVTGALSEETSTLADSDGAAAMLVHGTSGDYFLIVGAKALGSGRYDIVAIGTGGVTTGTAAIECNSNPCPWVKLSTNASFVENSMDAQCRYVYTGSVTLTEVGTSRIKGTFTGGGTCTAGASLSTGTATNGSFDVPLLPTVPAPPP
jgi:hypothetical protein